MVDLTLNDTIAINTTFQCERKRGLNLRVLLTKTLTCKLFPYLQDLTALAKELRAVEDVQPHHKVTDYSSSSEDLDSDVDDVVEQGDESTSGAEDSKTWYVTQSH